MVIASRSNLALLPRRTSVVVGLFVASVFACALFGLGRIGAFPDSVWNSAGQFLILAHTLVAYLLTTSIGDYARLVQWRGELSRQLSSDPRTVDSGPAGAGVEAIRDDLRARYAASEMRAAIDRRANLLARENHRRLWFNTAAAFLVPLFGALATLWNLRVGGNAEPFPRIGLPFLISILEVIPILVMTAALRSMASSALDVWRVVVEEVLGLRNLPGRVPDPEEAQGTRPDVPQVEAVTQPLPPRPRDDRNSPPKPSQRTSPPANKPPTAQPPPLVTAPVEREKQLVPSLNPQKQSPEPPKAEPAPPAKPKGEDEHYY